MAKTDMHEEPCSSPQPAWSRSFLRSRACLQTAPCSSSHLDFFETLGYTQLKQTLKILTIVGARPQFIKAAMVSRAFVEHNNGNPDFMIEEEILHTGHHRIRNCHQGNL